MARQVGKDFSINLTASQRAGTRALEELHTQGHIPTTNWFNLRSESITDKSPSTLVTRTLHFILEGGQRIEVRVMAWAPGRHSETEDSAEGRRWSPFLVFVERAGKMEALDNNLDARPWHRQRESDKPLPGAVWRAPIADETVAYATAVQNCDKGAFLKLFLIPDLDWRDSYRHLGLTGQRWVERILREIAQQ